jgi:hypothetical protein
VPAPRCLSTDRTSVSRHDHRGRPDWFDRQLMKKANILKFALNFLKCDTFIGM